MKNNAKLYPLLILAVINISTASILVRLAGVHGYVAATWRLVIASFLTLILLLIAGDHKRFRLHKINDFLIMSLSGIFLSLHFGLWMMSLSHLSVAVSVTIVDSYPAFMAIIGMALFKETYRKTQLLGAGIAIAGIALLSFHTAHGGIVPPGGDPVLGIILSALGMICVALYFTIGKGMRQRYTTLQYTLIVYSVASIFSIIIVKTMNLKLLGYSPLTYTYLALLALLPMLGGHTIINYVLEKMSLLAATIPILGEPVGAAILAWLLLDEKIDPLSILLMAIVITGIGLVVIEEK